MEQFGENNSEDKKEKSLKKNKKKRGGNRERYKVIEVPRNGESGEKKVMLCYMTSFGSFESLSKLTILSHRLTQISNAGSKWQSVNI